MNNFQAFLRLASSSLVLKSFESLLLITTYLLGLTLLNYHQLQTLDID